MEENTPAGLERATIHLEVLGTDRTLAVSVPRGEVPLIDILPVAREISRQATGVALEDAVRRGATISCRPGCTACCRHLVPLSPLEAVRLANLISSMPPERQSAVRARIEAAVRRMEAEGIVDAAAPKGRAFLRAERRARESLWENASRRYFELHLACPFLEDERCSIYEERPMSCQEYYVTTPAELCGRWNAGARDVERPVRMSEILADLGARVSGTPGLLIPLPLLLEWTEAHGSLLAERRDGETLFWALLEQLGGETGGDEDRPGGEGSQ